MLKQFDSCSYIELTECVKARIDWIREYDRFQKDMNLKEYDHIKSIIRLKKLSCKNEIKKLLQMRRILKKSGFKNWDSEVLSI